MQKVITAMGNDELWKKLKNIPDFEVLQKDILYKDAIIEILKKNKSTDLIIIHENLPGEIELNTLIKNIKLINNKINIIFILENKNEKLEQILINENIKNIFYNNEINFNEFIEKIKNLEYTEENLLKNEIKKLNKIILEKNEEILKLKKEENYKKNKITIITEINKKNLFKSLKKIKEKNYIYFSNYEKINKNIKLSQKIVFIICMNFNDLKNANKIIKLIQENYQINSNKINILLIKSTENTINFKIIKNNFKKYKILGKIKINNNKLIINKKIMAYIGNIKA